MRPLFTGSSVDAVRRCLGAATLPKVEEDRRDPALAAAGVAEHAEVLTVKNFPENLESWIRHHYLYFERPFVVDFSLNTSRMLGEGHDSELQRRPSYEIRRLTECAGTPDVFSYRIDADPLGGKSKIHLRLGDLKTGAGQASGTLPPPSEAGQLLFYVVAVLLELSWPAATKLASCEVAWFTRDYEVERDAEPELPPSKRTHRWKITAEAVTEDRLLEFLTEMEEVTRRLISLDAPVWTTGSHCAGCQGFSACPAQRGPIEQLGVRLAGPIADESIGALHSAIEAAKRLVEQGERVRDLYVQRRGGEVQTRRGYVLRQERTPHRAVTQIALPVLREAYPAEYARMVRESATIGRIAEALGEAKPGSRTEAVLDKLRSVPGALVETSSFSLRERRDRTE